MKIVIITGDDLRHTAFVQYICNIITPSLIIREPKGSMKGIKSQKIHQYLKDFAIGEKLYFKENQSRNEGSVRTEPGQVNKKKYVQLIEKANPDLILVFGASLLEDQIIGIPSIASLNIHTGITQLFRGVDSAFWAIHDAKPEGIGATVHKIDSSIDAGGILLQGRPNICIDDSIHDLFFKSVIVGFDIMKNALNKILRSKNLDLHNLKARGRLYQLRNFDEKSLIKAEQKRSIVLKEYLNNKINRDSLVPIVSNNVDY